MTGSGNDFVMLDGRHTTRRTGRRSGSRASATGGIGVGADGLVILTPEGAGRVRMDFWNCDGSRADMCGNAALCSTRLAAFLELAPGRRNAAGHPGRDLSRRRCLPGRASEAELNLPDFPLPAPAQPAWSRAPGEAPGTLATVGVPHLVVVVEDLERAGPDGRGADAPVPPALGPAGANVNFVAPATGGRRAAGGASGPTNGGSRGRPWPAGRGRWPRRSPWSRQGQASCPVDLLTRSGRPLSITATLSRRAWRPMSGSPGRAAGLHRGPVASGACIAS